MMEETVNSIPEWMDILSPADIKDVEYIITQNKEKRGDENKFNFFKVMYNSFQHRGFQYKLGYNRDVNLLNIDPNDQCVKGGLYFSDISNIFNHIFSYGKYVCGVVIDPFDKIIVPGSNTSFRSQSLYLGNPHDLTTPDGWKFLCENGFDYDNELLKQFIKVQENIGLHIKEIKSGSDYEFYSVLYDNISFEQYLMKYKNNIDIFDAYIKYTHDISKFNISKMDDFLRKYMLIQSKEIYIDFEKDYKEYSNDKRN